MAARTRTPSHSTSPPAEPAVPPRAASLTPASPEGREPTPRRASGLLEELLAQDSGEPPAPASTETIEGPERVEDRLRALAAREATVYLRTAGEVVRGRLVAIFADGPSPLHIALSGPAPAPPFTVDVVGYDAVHRFDANRAARIGDRLAVPVPPVLQQVRHRGARRVDVPPGFFAAFQHPALPGLHVRRAVRDISRTGIGLDIRVDHDLLAPGLTLPEVVVTPPTGAAIRFEASVRAIYPPRDGRASGAGLRVTPASAADARRWEQLVGDTLNPATQLGGTWSTDTWDLYEASGYFGLSGKAQGHFARLEAPFAEATRRVDAAPHLGCQVAWPSERGIEASLSMLKPYAHTWLGFQMAKRPGDPPDGTPGKDVLRDIHLRAYEHALSDPSLRWAWGIVQDTAKWSKLVHHDLPQRYVDAGRACIYPFHALELDAEIRPPRVPDLALGLATGDEQARLLEHLARHRPWAYRDAFDLVPERFDLGGLRDAWTGARLGRERTLLAARRDGAAVAFALVESAELGLHLFNLLDAVRLYAVLTDGVRAFRALLGAAAEWFRKRGRVAFTCLLEDGGPECATGLGARDLGRASHTLLASDLIPSLLEHVHEVTAPRIPRS